MVGTIIYEVSTIICDIGIINVRFYLLEVRYLHGYRKITHILLLFHFISFLYSITFIKFIPFYAILNIIRI